VVHLLTATCVLVQALRHTPSPRYSQIDYNYRQFDYIWEPPLSRGDFRVGDAAATFLPGGKGEITTSAGRSHEIDQWLPRDDTFGKVAALFTKYQAPSTKHQVPKS
jgi:hypothetical protein